MEPADVYAKRDALLVLDVREQVEWELGRIQEAVHIPMAEIPDRIHELEDVPQIVIVCRSGSRSGLVAEFLQENGLSAWNMDGGMIAWAEKGLPFTTPDGRPGALE
jgi:rhodanese-related sulfurtransferase